MAKKSLLANYNASLEAEEELVPVEEEELQSALAAVEEAGEEVEEVEDDVEEMEEVEEGLEAIAASLEAALQNGGLDPQAAQFCSHAIDGYAGRLGLEGLEIVPALEAFGSDTGREAATQVSLEGIGDTLKKIWAAIKAAIEKSIKAVADFFAKLWKGAEKIKARIAELEKAVAKADKDGDEAEKDATVAVPNPNSLMLGGKVEMSAILSGIANLKTASDSMHGSYLKEEISSIESMGKEIEGLMSPDQDAIDASYAKMAKMAEAKVSSIKSIQEKAFSGDKAVHVVTSEKPGDKSSKTTIESVKGASAFSSKGDIDVPKLADLKKLLADLKALASTIAGSDKDIEKLSKARDKAKVAAEKVIAKASKDEKIAGMLKGVKAKSILYIAQKNSAGPITSLDSHTFGTIRAALGLVEKSLKHYKAKDKK